MTLTILLNRKIITKMVQKYYKKKFKISPNKHVFISVLNYSLEYKNITKILPKYYKNVT